MNEDADGRWKVNKLQSAEDAARSIVDWRLVLPQRDNGPSDCYYPESHKGAPSNKHGLCFDTGPASKTAFFSTTGD